MRCGLNYVRFCDFHTKQCAGVTANQAAAKAMADAQAGGSLARRKVHAFAKHPSGSRPGTPGARFPSDVLVFGPHAPRPPGPANPQAQEEVPAVPDGGHQEEGALGDHQGAGPQVPAGELGPPVPQVWHEPGHAAQAHRPQNEAPGNPQPGAGGLRPSSPGGGDGPGDGRAAPTGAPGIRVFLGLGPCQEPAGSRQGVAKGCKAEKRAQAKAKLTPRRSPSQQTPSARTQEGPSEDPAGHIHQCLQRTGVAAARAAARAHGAPGSSNDPPPGARPAEGSVSFATHDATDLTPGPPGSSSDLPLAGRHPRMGVPLIIAQESQSGGGAPLRSSSIPDFVVPRPGGGGQQVRTSPAGREGHGAAGA